MRNVAPISVGSVTLTALCGGLVFAASLLARTPFASPVFYPLPASPSAVAVADIDLDGDKDIVALAATRLRVFLNDGAGSFAARDQTGLWTHEAHDLTVADLDRDGDADLTVAMSGIGANGFPDGTGRLGVLFNGGDGVFAPAVLYDSPGSTFSVVSADLNGDGFQDVASTGNSFRASVFLNDGAGTLTRIGDFGNGYTSTSIKAGDLDFDGDVDLAFANPGISRISVLRNAGDGTFPSFAFYEAGDNCNDVVMADTDRDGDLDLVSANYYGRNVSVLTNRGDASFEPHVTYPAGVFPVDLINADFDGDQWADLAVADRDGNAVLVLLNNGNGTYATASTVAAGGRPTRVETGDLNGDERADLVVLNAGSLQIAVLLGSADGTDPPPPPPPPVEISLAVAGTTTKPRSVDLRWTGATAPTVVISRNGTAIAQTPNDGQFADSPAARGTYRYIVCQQGPDVCSNQVTVRFSK